MAFAPSLVSKFPILDVPRESLSCGSCFSDCPIPRSEVVIALGLLCTCPAEMDRTGWF